MKRLVVCLLIVLLAVVSCGKRKKDRHRFTFHLDEACRGEGSDRFVVELGYVEIVYPEEITRTQAFYRISGQYKTSTYGEQEWKLTLDCVRRIDIDNYQFDSWDRIIPTPPPKK